MTAEDEDDLSWAGINRAGGDLFTIPVFEGPGVSEAFWGSDYVPQEDSGFGSSYHSVGMLCWRRFFYRNIEQLMPAWYDEKGVSPRSYAKLRGLLMHHAHEVIYGGDRGRLVAMSHEAVMRAFERLGWVARVQPYRELAAECERLLVAYVEKFLSWDRQHYQVVGVEEPMHVRETLDGEEFLYTVRQDLHVKDVQTELHYILEHKHFGRFSDSDKRTWPLNLQAQGQAWTFQKMYPNLPFGGVILNVVVTTKEPRFVRVPLSFSASRLRNFGKQMRAWHGMRYLAAREDWPQNFATCGTPYPNARGGSCDYFDICVAEVNLSDIRGRAAPAGFVRKERLIRKEDFRP